MTTIRELGEFGLIDRLARMVADAHLDAPSASGFRLHLGMGDDAAAWRVGVGLEVWTTDTLVEGVHFTRETIPWPDLGWKLLVVNLSDIAAMGALPLYALVTLGLPPDLSVAEVDSLYTGMLEACRRYGTLIVGGDVVAAPVTFLSATMMGASASEPMTRAAARPGDAIAVTGLLGASVGGLHLLQAGASPTDGPGGALVRAHRRPQPRLEEGRRLLEAGVRCAMDVSDGLVGDLAKLCRSSGVAARVEASRVPVDEALQQVLPDHALHMALNGGEEYQLLFTGPPALLQGVLGAMPLSAIIGQITDGEPGRVAVVDAEGRELSVVTSGWDHLRR